MCSSLLLHKAGVCFSRRDVIKAAGIAAIGALAVTTGKQAHAQEQSAKPKPAQTQTMVQFDPGRLVDLTHTLTPAFPVFPGGKQMKITPLSKVVPDGYLTNRWEIDEHTGTHMDAPAHFIDKAVTSDKLPVSSFICPMVIIDITSRAAKNHDAAVTVDNLATWEKSHGRIPAGACVVMRSGWDKRLKKPATFLNQDDKAVMHSPGFSEEAARFLIDERNISGIGVDTISLDIGASTSFQAHRVVLGAGRWGIECLANLGQVPEAGATIFIAPVKVENCSGGPVRAYAALPR